MSMSDCESSSLGNTHQNFREASRHRILLEMMRYTYRPDSRSNRKVLVTDKVTRKIVSNLCKMTELREKGISLVEDINKQRQSLIKWVAVYFIQPTKENVFTLLSDMGGRNPLYKYAYIFFSSAVSPELLTHLKYDQTIKSRLYDIVEINLEYIVIDNQCFITDHGKALEDLYGDEEIQLKGDECLDVMASRVATVFASMLEFPFVRYQAAQTTTMTPYGNLLPSKLAAAIWSHLMQYKTLNNFPQTETCELLILDRSMDQIAPIIHEWTYDAMCHDLLQMDGEKYIHEVTSEMGDFEKKEVLLEEHDPVWLELRHSHIKHARNHLHDKIANLISKEKVGEMHQGLRDGGELSIVELQRLVQELPKDGEQMDKLALHVNIAARIHSICDETLLKDVGKLEQDLVFGVARTEDVILFLKKQKDIKVEYKVRLLMIYAATRPYSDRKLKKLMELAKLSSDDMNAVYNMRFLKAEEEIEKTSTTCFYPLSRRKKKHFRTKHYLGEESSSTLSRFHPMIEELIEKLNNNELSLKEYPCMNDPRPAILQGASQSLAADVLDNDTHLRSRKSWPSIPASRRRSSSSLDGYSSENLSRMTSEFKKTGNRLFIFIIGGTTRSELRVCHQLSAKFRREIILGSSSLDDPAEFVEKLKALSPSKKDIVAEKGEENDENNN